MGRGESGDDALSRHASPLSSRKVKASKSIHQNVWMFMTATYDKCTGTVFTMMRLLSASADTSNAQKGPVTGRLL